MSEQHTLPNHNAEAEFYAEPAAMTARDTAGVVVALIALLLLGGAGYVWLNPDLSLGGLLSGHNSPASAPVATAAPKFPPPMKSPSSKDTSGQARPIPADPALLAAANADRQAECPQCGMVAGASAGEVVARLSDESVAHFDSWVCVFGYAKDKGLAVDEAVVLRHGSSPEQPEWLAASSATYLFDTKRIAGSMPPYNAAFASKIDAQTAQASDGGEIQSWEELQTKFK